jgi:hypothetical protein
MRAARRAAAYVFGVTPVTALNIRWKWNRLSPAAAASVSSASISSVASIRRHASAITCASRSARGGSVGRQRLQARKPARSAAVGDAWNATLRRSARRAGHDGRQYTPVVATE